MYMDVQIGFSQQHFEKHLQNYYIIRDLRKLNGQIDRGASGQQAIQANSHMAPASSRSANAPRYGS